MTSSPSPSTENRCSDVVTDAANLSKNKDLEHMEDDEEEDEEGDIDFNPFLKEAPSVEEASSSLSSDIEEFNADVDSGQNHSPVKNIEHSQETVTKPAESLCNKDNQPNIATSDSQKPILDSDDEDAIWRRTRARYSLVGSTLDELETFLQETDDEDDLYNIDDEQEYRKFLAAVLQDGDANSGALQETENVDEDEDEDNDADFELELEEALGSDLDENLQIISQEHERRPETRQKKRQKTDVHKKKFSGETNSNRPLRPILPYAPISSPYMIQNMSSTSNEYTTAFTPHQIGQLHCLIYEHVQLLVQVLSLSILEPSRQHIATQVQSLLLEMIHKRDQVMASQKAPYPSFCFSLPYIHSTVNFSLPYNSSESDEGSFFWVPFVSENLLSVIDVAPLNLVGSYIDDVSIAVQEHQRRQIEVTYDATTTDKECLFPFSNFPSSADSDPNTVSPRANDPKSKKTIAATAVERSKKQSVALVPKEIARLALRFFPFFNPALFPHKPPPVSVANRFLFTDAEDGLLARGLMEYNTNWKEIQKHFLPCKTPHQIFVRQKNRSCSRAPENPIKAVRRWKTSPLTPQEKARIEEGLKVYKLDWMAVWKYMVPYRDPTLLARQYRTAVGNQKSYKGDEFSKAKRRSYESKRRRTKIEGSRFQSTGREGWSTEEDATPGIFRDKENCSTDNAPGEINSGDDGGNNEDEEAYVHEAFLSDWRPENHPATSFTQHERLLPNYPTRLVNFHPQNPIPARISRPEVQLQSYQARRSRCSRVVKLAPDLPPVNLPPTVRIMSQSAFTKYNEASSKSVAVSVTPLTREENTGKGNSDLQMHPLLFQDNEDGSLPYYPLNPSVGSSSSFDFFPNNLNLFRYSHQEKHTLNFFNNSLKSKELSSSGVEFHPLLQKTDDGIGNSGVTVVNPPPESSTPHRRVPRSPNELDLDIRLSSSARNRDSGHQDTGLAEGNGNDEIVMEQEELSDSEEEEEVAESVEFECEEMTDSEGEGGSDSDHGENLQNEELQDDVLVKAIDEVERCKSDVAIGLSLNPKLPLTRKSRSSKNTTLPVPTPPQIKKPRKRAQKLDPR